MFKGSFVAIITPMNQDFSIDYQSLEKLIEYHIKNKTDGIVAVGTTGESPTLSHKEHKDVIEFCVNKVNHKIPVIAGAGSNNTAEAIDLALFSKKAGADASLQVTPYYNKPTQAGMVHHFKQIAKYAPFPHILYNVPSRTNCDLLPQTTIELSKVSHIVGIKEAASDGANRVKTFLDEVDSNFSILSGNDDSLNIFLKNGGHGVISVTANLAANEMHNLCQFGLNHNFLEMEKIHSRLMGLHQNLFIEPSPTALKWAMSQLNMTKKYVRSPLIDLTEESQPKVLDALKKADLIE